MKITHIHNSCIIFLIIYIEISSSSFTQFKEGDQCDDKKLQSACQNVKKCPAQAELVRKGLEPDLCGIRRQNLVCCSKTSKKNGTDKKYELAHEEVINKSRKIIKREAPGGKSKKMCEKYAEYVFDHINLTGGTEVNKVDTCAVNSSPLVVGGEAAHAKEFPHMALIGFSQNGSDVINWQCGGSLISERWILSAAHCAKAKNGLASWAILGDLIVLSDNDTAESRPVQLKIVDRIVHPSYDSSVGYNDIALFKLERDVEFNAYLRPLCLDAGNSTVYQPDKDKAIATGWGRLKYQGPASQTLQKVVLNLFDMLLCDRLFQKSRNPSLRSKIPNGITAHNLVCAWERGKDTCQGDSGGPLQQRLMEPYCMYSIIGITSFGENCAKELPGVYTRVSHYIPWIESIVWP